MVRLIITLSKRSQLFFFCVFLSCSRDTQEIQKAFELLTFPQNKWAIGDFGPETDQELKDLLRRHAPAFWVSAGSCVPMDFYRQYVPLLRFHREGVSGEVLDRGILKKFERDFSVNYELAASPDCLQNVRPPLYAYAWHEQMALADGRKVPVKVLNYAFSFYKSGLPAQLGFFQGMGLFGRNDFWHYLDIHGAIFLLLNEQSQLFSLVLAQHNHFRTFIVGADISQVNPIEICFAIRSNEPYLCPDKKKSFPTAPTWQEMRFITTGMQKPFLGAYDLVPEKKSRERLSYRLEFLRHRDPLITSWVPLGPEIKIWGIFSTFFRRSPPGMAIYTTPALLPFSKTAQYFYFDPSNDKAFTIHAENMKDFLNPEVERVFVMNQQHFLSVLNKSGFFVDQ